jgi:hypothetical protein
METKTLPNESLPTTSTGTISPSDIDVPVEGNHQQNSTPEPPQESAIVRIGTKILAGNLCREIHNQ